MTSLINASNSAGVIITSDTSGNLAIQSGGNTVATITATGANAGIQVASWANPAFSAWANSTTSFTTSVNTKIAFNSKEFDTANCYDATTNYRYTPNVAGYYQVTAGNIIAPNTSGNRWLYLYKNGTFVKTIGFCPPAGINYSQTYGAGLIYMNGTTDYIEIYGIQNSGSTLTNAASQTDVYFQACLVRSA